METKTRLVHEEIERVEPEKEGRVFYRYKTVAKGKDTEGKDCTFECVKYLDSDFNTFAGRIKIGDPINDNTKVGSLLPGEIGEENEIGIWQITPPTQKNKFRALILRQETKKAHTASNEQVPATWVSRH